MIVFLLAIAFFPHSNEKMSRANPLWPTRNQRSYETMTKGIDFRAFLRAIRYFVSVV
jgi:hypothetical protein